MDRTTAWLRSQIAACVPAPGRSPALADKLIDATEAIWRGSGMVFGTVLPSRLAERDVLLSAAVAALEAWLPALAEDQRQLVADLARRTGLAIAGLS